MPVKIEVNATPEQLDDFYLGRLLRNELSRGGYWQRKGQPRSIAMSFSLVLVNEAGGIRKLLEEWDQIA